MADLPSLPVLTTGTVPEHRMQVPSRGRFSIVAADDKEYLYIPEIQRLFRVDNSISDVLVRSNNGELSSQCDVAKFILKITAKVDAAPLSGTRHATHGLRDLVVHVSQICNLRCSYCYAHDLNKANKTMIESTASQVVSRTLNLSREGLNSVKFLGGEPTIAWPIVEYLVRHFKEQSNRRKFPVPFFHSCHKRDFRERKYDYLCRFCSYSCIGQHRWP